MRIKLIVLMVLALVIGGCDLRGLLPIGVPVRYMASGVCAGVELTDKNGGIVGISLHRFSGVDYPLSDPSQGVVLRRDQPVRIPDPGPTSTGYMLSYRDFVRVGDSFTVDLEWKCLPDKQPLRIQQTFTSGVGSGFVITENVALPAGLEIVAQDPSR